MPKFAVFTRIAVDRWPMWWTWAMWAANDTVAIDSAMPAADIVQKGATSFQKCERPDLPQAQRRLSVYEGTVAMAFAKMLLGTAAPQPEVVEDDQRVPWATIVEMTDTHENLIMVRPRGVRKEFHEALQGGHSGHFTVGDDGGHLCFARQIPEGGSPRGQGVGPVPPLRAILRSAWWTARRCLGQPRRGRISARSPEPIRNCQQAPVGVAEDLDAIRHAAFDPL